MRSVNLSDCSTLTDKSISLITGNLKDLVVLYLKHCHRVTGKLSLPQRKALKPVT